MVALVVPKSKRLNQPYHGIKNENLIGQTFGQGKTGAVGAGRGRMVRAFAEQNSKPVCIISRH